MIVGKVQESGPLGGVAAAPSRVRYTIAVVSRDARFVVRRWDNLTGRSREFMQREEHPLENRLLCD